MVLYVSFETFKCYFVPFVTHIKSIFGGIIYLVSEMVTPYQQITSISHRFTEQEVLYRCPDCDYEDILETGTYEREIVQCGGCGVELEVIFRNEFGVDLAPQEEEDWGE
jgi:alpha-aminoadipate carrier protein LysW